MSMQKATKNIFSHPPSIPIIQGVRSAMLVICKGNQRICCKSEPKMMKNQENQRVRNQKPILQSVQEFQNLCKVSVECEEPPKPSLTTFRNRPQRDSPYWVLRSVSLTAGYCLVYNYCVRMISSLQVRNSYCLPTSPLCS